MGLGGSWQLKRPQQFSAGRVWVDFGRSWWVLMGFVRFLRSQRFSAGLDGSYLVLRRLCWSQYFRRFLVVLDGIGWVLVALGSSKVSAVLGGSKRIWAGLGGSWQVLGGLNGFCRFLQVSEGVGILKGLSSS